MRRHNKSSNKKDNKKTLNFESDSSMVVQEGFSSLKEVMTADNIDRSNPSSLIVNTKHMRCFRVSEFPSNVYVGWLDSLYNYPGNIDISKFIFPIENQDAIDSLTSQITQFDSQLDLEEKKGEVRNTTRYRDMIAGLVEKRRNIERGVEKIYHVQIVGAVNTDSQEDLDKDMQKLTARLRGNHIGLNQLYFEQEDGFKSILPLGLTAIKKFRNFTSGALTACFPFYNAEVLHDTGVVCGVNMITGSPVSIDFYDRSILPNSNSTVIGQSGMGKTYFVSLLTVRSALVGIRSCIFDPEGEFDKVTRALGGRTLDMYKDFPNVFDLEEEELIDENTGKGTGEFFVNIKEKVSDLLSTVSVMLKGEITPAQQSVLSEMLFTTYRSRGFSENPNSLYSDSVFDAAANKFYMHGKKKPMPVFSDFCNHLQEYINQNGDDIGMISCLKGLELFKKGQVYDLIDRQTSSELENFGDAPVISFNSSKIENGQLRPLGMFIPLQWSWGKFIKKNPHIRKRIVADEAWMLVSKNFQGHEYTGTYLEQMARRIRKRNGGLLVASQNFSEFKDSIYGRAILRQSVVNILLKQVDSDKDELREIFNLSEGELQFLLTAKRGEALFKVNGETIVVRVEATPLEHQVIDPKEPNPFLAIS